MNIKTPMLDKMLSVQEQSQVCGEFLAFLQKKYDMFERDPSKSEPYYVGVGDHIDTEKVLAEFFGIDLIQAEREKKDLLKNIT